MTTALVVYEPPCTALTPTPALDPEVIIAIPGHAGYHCTPSGDVYSTRGKKGFRKLTPHDDHRGYLIVHIKRDNGKPRAAKVQHLVLETFVGPKPSPTHLARHFNDDALDNRLENLAWGTYEENQQDKAANRKRQKLGVANKRKTSRERIRIAQNIYRSGAASLNEIMELTSWNKDTVRKACGIRELDLSCCSRL